MEEVDRLGIAAVLAADADLEVRPRLAGLVGRYLDQPPDALRVERLERAEAEDAEIDVTAEESALDVVAAETPAHLGEVVGAEGEELGGLGDLACGERRARDLDHRADQRVHTLAGLLGDCLEDPLGLFLDDLEL